MKKRIAALLLPLLMLPGCSGDRNLVVDQTVQTEITLSWWGNDTRNEYTLDAIGKFEEQHPDIKVKCSYSEWSGYEALNQVRMVSGTETDVMQINVGWLEQYSPDGKGYYDISQLSDTVDLSNFPDDILEYGKRGGILNALPIAMNAQTVYINKTVYDRYGLDIPASWDDFFAAAKIMKTDGIYPLSGPAKSIWLLSIAYAEQQTGKHFFNENSEMAFAAGDLKIMIEFYTRLVKEGVVPKVEDYQKFNIENGSYAGVVAWVSDAMNLFSGNIEAGEEIIAAEYPVGGSLPSGTGWYAKPATLYAVSKYTEHPHEAALLLDYMLNGQDMASYQGVEKGIPISSAARSYLDEAGELSGLQYEASLVMENNEYLSSMDPLVENKDIYSDYIDAADRVLFDKETAEEASQKLYEKYSESYTMAE